VTAHRRPAKRLGRRCSWHHCPAAAGATVAFELPNLLAGSRRDYCAAHTMQVCMARGAVVVARFGPHQPPLPGLPDAPPARRAGRTGRKGVVP
jgi:hypothetical protein